MLAYSNLMNQITDPNIQILNVEYSVRITMEKDMLEFCHNVGY